MLLALFKITICQVRSHISCHTARVDCCRKSTGSQHYQLSAAEANHNPKRHCGAIKLTSCERSHPAHAATARALTGVTGIQNTCAADAQIPTGHDPNKAQHTASCRCREGLHESRHCNSCRLSPRGRLRVPSHHADCHCEAAHHTGSSRLQQQWCHDTSLQH